MSVGTRPLSPSDAYAALGYLAICWRAGGAAPSALDAIEAALGVHASTFKLRLSRPGLLVFSADAPHLSCLVDRSATTILLGTVLDRASLDAAGANSADVDNLAGLDDGRLFRTVWGGYVAIRRQAGPPYLCFLRDPSGAVPALVVEGEGFVLLTPSLPRWLRQAAGVAPEIDLPMLAHALANPLLPTHRSLLRGVHQLPAGSAIDWDGDSVATARTLWPDPALMEAPSSDDGAPLRLRESVTGCLRAFGARHGSVIIELSGGLDSAIVLGALASGETPPEISCVNFAVAHAGGDERAEARSVADRWNARLVEVKAEAAELKFEDMFAAEQPVEPVLYGLDPILERASIGVAKAFDASAILTGQGGDAVFCNLPTPLIAVDYMRAVGWPALWSRIAYDTAQRAHCSIWKVHRAMLADRLTPGRARLDPLPGVQLSGTAGEGWIRHPWLSGDSAMAPARQMQFEAISNCQNFNSPTWRRGAAALIHPLLAQPIVEACLAIPTYRLAQGSGNRGLARALFAEWLPDIVRTRRDKGDATNYYRRAVAENADFLRGFLLDGVLVGHGLLDGAGIADALRDESLIWSHDSRLIVVYASFEAWARYWGLGASA